MLVLAIVLLSPFYYSVLAGDQIKSNTFLVGTGTQTGAISSQTDLPVAFYLGNDLTGVASPVKKAVFRVSFSYNGTGSVQFKIDSDSATAKSFTLNTNRQSQAELIYKDDTGKMDVSSAGNYSHILNVIPSGVSLSNLSVQLDTTYQFAPNSCVDGSSNNQKVKTTEFYVGQINDTMGATAAMPFSVYIGDNLTGVTNPVKSVYFLVTGVYAASGSGTLSLNTNSGPTKSFTLENTSGPANFNIVYKDDSGAINPVTAGSYSYNLNLSQTNLTITNLSVKAILTHQYKPVSCGVTYPPYGDLVSATYDSTANTDGAAYNSIMWKGKLGGASLDKGQVLFQMAASDSTSGPWNYVGGLTCGSGDWFSTVAGSPTQVNCFSSLNNKRYFKYKIRICSDDCVISGNSTPTVDDVVVNYSP